MKRTENDDKGICDKNMRQAYVLTQHADSFILLQKRWFVRSWTSEWQTRTQVSVMTRRERTNSMKRIIFAMSLLLILVLGTALTAYGNSTPVNQMSLNEYAALAMEQAQVAADSGTFGVGGILMDLNGHIICKMHNQVIKGNRINDPTAHGERRIIEWYLENKEKEKLPEPENCILITTLDPCVMCTGALAQVQFHTVIVIALDDYAGINWDGSGECSALDGTDCQTYVKEHFAYPQVTGDLSREAFGKDLSELNLFSDITISSEIVSGCQEAFSLTADHVRDKVSSASVELADMKNPANLQRSHPIRKYLEASFGSDFLACSWNPQNPADEIVAYIQKNHPGFHGVAYFDMFGNLLYLAEDDNSITTRSAFMNVTRKYAAVRNTEPIDGYEINEYLSNPQYGYFVYMTCPEVSTKTIMELGAIGSTLENTSVHPIMYIDAGNENEIALNAIIKKLPPLYNDNINIRFEQVALDNR